MNLLIFGLIISLFSPISKYEAKKEVNINFEKKFEVLKIYLEDAIINVYEDEKNIGIKGEIKIYHRNQEKAEDYLKNIKIETEEVQNSLKLFANYSKDRKGREAKKLSKIFVLNLYLPKDLPLGIYLKNGEVNFKEKQERNIVVEGNNLRIYGVLSNNYKKIEAYNHIGDVEISSSNFIKRYLFPFGKKVIYLNPKGEKEGYFNIFKGIINLKIGE